MAQVQSACKRARGLRASLGRDCLPSSASRKIRQGRWRCYAYDELLKRDKLSLDLFWIKDKSLTDTDSLPLPDVIAHEIADDLETALEQFTKIRARWSTKA